MTLKEILLHHGKTLLLITSALTEAAFLKNKDDMISAVKEVLETFDSISNQIKQQLLEEEYKNNQIPA